MKQFLLIAPASAFVASQSDVTSRQLEADRNCSQVTTVGSHWNVSPWTYYGCGRNMTRVVTCAGEDTCTDPAPASTGECDAEGMPECDPDLMAPCPWTPVFSPDCNVTCGLGETNVIDWVCESVTCTGEKPTDYDLTQECRKEACPLTEECISVGQWKSSRKINPEKLAEFRDAIEILTDEQLEHFPQWIQDFLHTQKLDMVADEKKTHLFAIHGQDEVVNGTRTWNDIDSQLKLMSSEECLQWCLVQNEYARAEWDGKAKWPQEDTCWSAGPKNYLATDDNKTNMGSCWLRNERIANGISHYRGDGFSFDAKCLLDFHDQDGNVDLEYMLQNLKDLNLAVS